MLTQSELQAALSYDEATGRFTWLSGKFKGKEAAPKNVAYHRIHLNGRRYLKHRLAWLYVHGSLPDGDIDHINGDPTDCRIENLRPATRSQNLANQKVSFKSKTGAKGVFKHRNKFRARIVKNGECWNVGSFNTIEEASAAYLAAAKTLFGEFARAA